MIRPRLILVAAAAALALTGCSRDPAPAADAPSAAVDQQASAPREPGASAAAVTTADAARDLLRAQGLCVKALKATDPWGADLNTGEGGVEPVTSWNCEADVPNDTDMVAEIQQFDTPGQRDQALSGRGPFWLPRGDAPLAIRFADNDTGAMAASYFAESFSPVTISVASGHALPEDLGEVGLCEQTTQVDAPAFVPATGRALVTDAYECTNVAGQVTATIAEFANPTQRTTALAGATSGLIGDKPEQDPLDPNDSPVWALAVGDAPEAGAVRAYLRLVTTPLP